MYSFKYVEHERSPACTLHVIAWGGYAWECAADQRVGECHSNQIKTEAAEVETIPQPNIAKLKPPSGVMLLNHISMSPCSSHAGLLITV